MALGQEMFSARDLRHTAEVTSRVISLPGVPTTDWCVRAAVALFVPREGIVAYTGILRADAVQLVVFDEMVLPGSAAENEAGTLDEAETRMLSTRLKRGLSYRLISDEASYVETDQDADGNAWLYVLLRVGRRQSNAWFALVYRSDAEHHIPSVKALIESALPVINNKIQFTFQGFRDRQPEIASPAEYRVLERIVLGHTINVIACDLDRSPHTVHDHLKSLHRKFHAKTRGELIARVLGGGREMIGLTPSEAQEPICPL